MTTLKLIINGSAHTIEAEPAMPLLWVLRDLLNLTGSKFGCGIGACGACTVLLDATPVRACMVPVAATIGKGIMTIEGLADADLHPVQQAWLAESVAQCGYCQAGQMMTAVALLQKTPKPTASQIDAAFADNLCRCGTYLRIRRAVQRVAGEQAT